MEESLLRFGPKTFVFPVTKKNIQIKIQRTKLCLLTSMDVTLGLSY
jgi:hypothetical protein